MSNIFKFPCASTTWTLERLLLVLEYTIFMQLPGRALVAISSIISIITYWPFYHELEQEVPIE